MLKEATLLGPGESILGWCQGKVNWTWGEEGSDFREIPK